MIIALIGPVDYWWNNNWQTPAHIAYMAWRKEVNDKLVAAGHLVYRPHEAFKGAWDENAQQVNYAALTVCSVVICVRPPGIPARGTEAEIVYAEREGKVVYYAPPGDWSDIERFIIPLEDVYDKVEQRSLNNAQSP